MLFCSAKNLVPWRTKRSETSAPGPALNLVDTVFQPVLLIAISIESPSTVSISSGIFIRLQSQSPSYPIGLQSFSACSIGDPQKMAHAMQQFRSTLLPVIDIEFLLRHARPDCTQGTTSTSPIRPSSPPLRTPRSSTSTPCLDRNEVDIWHEA